MTLTSVELIDVLRREASRIEEGKELQNLPIEEIIKEVQSAGVKASSLEQIEFIRKQNHTTEPTGLAAHFRRWADALEKQLLATLDLPVDISFLRNAA